GRLEAALRRDVGPRAELAGADLDRGHGRGGIVAGGDGVVPEARARRRGRRRDLQHFGLSRRIDDAVARAARVVPHVVGVAAQSRRAGRIPQSFSRRRTGGRFGRADDAGRGRGGVVCPGLAGVECAGKGGSVMTGVLRRIGVMIGLNTRRTFSSPGNVLWILIVPIVFSLILAAFFGGQDAQSPATNRVEYETPRGGTDGQGLVKLRITFGIYLVFTLAALFGRGGALHQEHK